MAEESPPLTDDQLAQELTTLADDLSKVQDDMEKKLQEAVKEGGDAVERLYRKDFHQSNDLLLSVWFPQIQILGKLGKVSSDEALDEYFKSRYGNAKLRSAYEDWLEVEQGWADFLKNSLDTTLNKKYSEGLPTSVDPVKKSISIVIVCAGTTEGGRMWRDQTGINQFPILADSKHKFLDTFKYPRSTWNTCRPHYAKSFVYQSRQQGGSFPIPKSKEEFGGMLKFAVMDDKTHDTHQMGGTIVMSSEGKIHYLQQSKSTTDRPPAATVFAAIPKC